MEDGPAEVYYLLICEVTSKEEIGNHNSTMIKVQSFKYVLKLIKTYFIFPKTGVLGVSFSSKT